MLYHSTRDNNKSLTAAGAIAGGLAKDGGLYVPEGFPGISVNDIEKLVKMDYRGRAKYIMSLYLDDFTVDELTEYTSKAYADNYDSKSAAPVYSVDDKTHFLELWHGPTSAFKDMALQMLPYLMTASMKKTGEKRQVCILTATSGDTGKAALEGFCDVEGTKIIVFYPENGVSDVQAMQMTSQEGKNVSVYAVKGNFDDAQTGVKTIFSDEELREKLDGEGWFLSSANSINWGRLLPQIVYYISAYCDLVAAGKIAAGDKINFCVPTGNFGNILAGFYAMNMGLPVNRLICASNSNDVLTDFISTGVYDRNRPFFTTISPSMDILVSSNLERLLYHVSGENDEFVRDCMSKLSSDGKYAVSEDVLANIQNIFSCGCCGEEETKAAVADVYNKYNYLIDTHTAVAYSVLEKYRTDTGDDTVSVVVSTASPYKFCGAVLDAIGGECAGSGLDMIDALEEKTGVKAPAPLAGLRGKTVRFTGCVEKTKMTDCVVDFIKE